MSSKTNGHRKLGTQMGRFWSAVFAMIFACPMLMGASTALAVSLDDSPVKPVNENVQTPSETAAPPITSTPAESNSLPVSEGTKNGSDLDGQPTPDPAMGAKESTCYAQTFQPEDLEVPIYFTYTLDRLISPSMGFALGTLKTVERGKTDQGLKERLWIPETDSETGVLIRYQKPINKIEPSSTASGGETDKNSVDQKLVYGGKLAFASFFPGDPYSESAKEKMNATNNNLIVSEQVARVRFNLLSFEEVGTGSLLLRFPNKNRDKAFDFLAEDGNLIGDLKLGDKAEAEVFFTRPGAYRLKVSAQIYLEGKDKEGNQKKIMGPQASAYYAFLVGEGNQTLPAGWIDNTHGPIPCVTPSKPDPEHPTPEPEHKPTNPTPQPSPEKPEAQTGLPVIAPNLPIINIDDRPTGKPDTNDYPDTPKSPEDSPSLPSEVVPSPSQPPLTPEAPSKPTANTDQSGGESGGNKPEGSVTKPAKSLPAIQQNDPLKSSTPKKEDLTTKSAPKITSQPASNQSTLSSDLFRPRTLNGYELATKLDSKLDSEVPGETKKVRANAPVAVANRIVDQSQNTILLLGLGLTAVVGLSIAGTGIAGIRGR